MKNFNSLLIVFLGFQIGFSFSVLADPKIKSVEEAKLLRKPTSDKDCSHVNESIQQNYIQEFGLADTEARNVYVNQVSVSGRTFAQATHQSQCSAKGCGTTLSYLRSKECPKLVLVFNGDFIFTGGENKRYSHLKVRSKSESIDGGPSIFKFEFDENELVYRELKKE